MIWMKSNKQTVKMINHAIFAELIWILWPHNLDLALDTMMKSVLKYAQSMLLDYQVNGDNHQSTEVLRLSHHRWLLYHQEVHQQMNSSCTLNGIPWTIWIKWVALKLSTTPFTRKMIWSLPSTQHQDLHTFTLKLLLILMVLDSLLPQPTFMELVNHQNFQIWSSSVPYPINSVDCNLTISMEMSRQQLSGMIPVSTTTSKITFSKFSIWTRTLMKMLLVTSEILPARTLEEKSTVKTSLITTVITLVTKSPSELLHQTHGEIPNGPTLTLMTWTQPPSNCSSEQNLCFRTLSGVPLYHLERLRSSY